MTCVRCGDQTPRHTLGQRYCQPCERDVAVRHRSEARDVAPDVDALATAEGHDGGGTVTYAERRRAEMRTVADFCRWEFRSGWATGMTCSRVAWYDLDGEPRCWQHRWQHRKTGKR